MTELSLQTAELLPAREALSGFNTVTNIITNFATAQSDFDAARATSSQTAVVLNSVDN